MKDEMIFSDHGETLVCGKFRVETGNVFELGRWQSRLGGEDLTYAKDPDQKLLYSYDFYHVAADTVVGYLIGYDRNVLCDTPYAKTYDRVYEVIDFSVDCGELDEHCGELLIAYARNVARERACSGIVIKHVEKYAAFNRFCEKRLTKPA